MINNRKNTKNMETISTTKQRLMQEAVKFYTIHTNENYVINTNNMATMGHLTLHYDKKEYAVRYIHFIEPGFVGKRMISIINGKTFISDIEIHEFLNYAEIAKTIYLEYFINQ